MTTNPFPHAITPSQSASQEQPQQPPSQPRSESPSPTPSQATSSIDISNPMQHFYSPLLSSPPLGSSPASVIYAPLPSHSQSQTQTQTQVQSEAQSCLHLQQTLAPPPFHSSHHPLQNPVSQNCIPQSQQATHLPPPPPQPQPRPHPLLSPFIPPPSYQNTSPHLPRFSMPISESSLSSDDSETEAEEDRGDGGGGGGRGRISGRRERMTWEEHEEELKIQRAKRMCAWFTGVMVVGLVGVGGVRWWVYG
ncbi:hypothetical protein SBOR_4293 [Sclerotinia borealis F-4128]|uniref:Uncharacterized protein n=1 Tax=Sclerotinia borealis (strain F-4128) TaxID=1432307 RepID=W9CHC1_SCLBF|nr:hypothetical protein SBOR_4293 [Sclerotinia borealis F-4128]